MIPFLLAYAWLGSLIGAAVQFGTETDEGRTNGWTPLRVLVAALIGTVIGVPVGLWVAVETYLVPDQEDR
jgi:ABC-type nitrate/sulfonate/bicarbonate transport system permease component